MKRIILLITLALFAFKANAQLCEFKVAVKVKNYPQAQFNVVAIVNEDITREALVIKDGYGEVSVKLPLYTSASLISTDPGNRIPVGAGIIPGHALSFYVDGSDILIEMDYSKWPYATLKGGKINNQLNSLIGKTGLLKNREFSLRKELVSLENEGKKESAKYNEITQEMTTLKEKIQKEEEQFVVDNPGSYVALALLNGQRNSFEIDEFAKRYNNLSTDIRATPVGVALGEYIKTSYSTSIGRGAPSFVKKDSNGKEVRLEDYRGKYLLIDFWGTWCVPCRNSHPHLVQLYQKYNKLGVEFLNVAQESSVRARDLWLKVIKEDNLTWTQILNNEEIEQCDLTKLFGITAFPTKVLIDKEGVIIGRFVGDSQEIDILLKKIFNQ